VLELSGAAYTIGLVSAGITLVSTLVRHAVLDQKKVVEQKAQIEHHKEKLKEAQKKKDMKGMQHHQQQMLEVSMEQMQQGMKPALFTMVPFLIVFSWMGSNFGNIGILQDVTVTDAFPAGAQLVSAHAAPYVNYTADGAAVVWHLGNLTHNWDWGRFGWYPDGQMEVNLTFRAPPGDAPAALSANFTTHFLNGSVEGFYGMDGSDKSSPFYVVKANQSVGGSDLSYTLYWENRNPYYVAWVFGIGLGWLRWYILCSFVSSMAFNKVIERLTRIDASKNDTK
jgi:uncharacterized membrane protein (DUF106 family)